MRKELQEQFTEINWGKGKKDIPRSGHGSTEDYTAGLRAELPRLFRAYNVTRFLDAPCGDWTWMRLVDLDGIDYVGLDIVEDIIAQNRAAHGRKTVRFGTADITSDPLPHADLMMVRDCLFHLQFEMIWAFLRNFAASGIPFLFTTSHHEADANRDLRRNGRFRLLNLQIAPFHFEPPIYAIGDTPEGSDHPPRIMGVWSRTQVNAVLRQAEDAGRLAS
ncbi:MAG: class I SAM-dependent methyltransferase [Pseudomonadota bacterium]